MKAKNNKTNETLPKEMQETVKSNVPTPILKQEEVAKKFVHISDKMDKYNDLSLNVKVEDEDSLIVAENNLKDIAELEKSADKVRKTLKAPYFETVKMVDNYAKTVTEPLNNYAKRFKEVISQYKIVQEASARKAREEKEAELRQHEAEKSEELDKLRRVEKQLHARIYGGVYRKKDGAPLSSSGCITENDCDNMKEFIEEKYPAEDSFKHYKELRNEVLSSTLKRLSQHKADIIDTNSTDKTAKAGALKRIQNAKNSSEIESENSFEKMKEDIEKDTAKSIRKEDRSIAKAKKGIRRTLKYEVIEEEKLTREFLTADHEKLKEYAGVNSEKIKELIKEGKQNDILPGIKFYMDEQYVSR